MFDVTLDGTKIGKVDELELTYKNEGKNKSSNTDKLLVFSAHTGNGTGSSTPSCSKPVVI